MRWQIAKRIPWRIKRNRYAWRVIVWLGLNIEEARTETKLWTAK